MGSSFGPDALQRARSVYHRQAPACALRSAASSGLMARPSVSARTFIRVSSPMLWPPQTRCAAALPAIAGAASRVLRSAPTGAWLTAPAEESVRFPCLAVPQPPLTRLAAHPRQRRTRRDHHPEPPL